MAKGAALRLLAGLTIFCVAGLQDVDLHRLVSHNALKPPVFLRQRPRITRLVNLHTAILALPLGVSLLADVVTCAHVPDLHPTLRFAQVLTTLSSLYLLFSWCSVLLVSEPEVQFTTVFISVGRPFYLNSCWTAEFTLIETVK